MNAENAFRGVRSSREGAAVLSDEEIRERDGWRCARCGKAHDLHVHHRFPRAGGSDESAANRVTLCAGCHMRAHRHPAEARAEGWVVRAESAPEAVPVAHWMWPAGPILLLPDGSISLVIDTV